MRQGRESIRVKLQRNYIYRVRILRKGGKMNCLMEISNSPPSLPSSLFTKVTFTEVPGVNTNLML